MKFSPRRVSRLVTSFREGREIPPDLFDRDAPDQTLALITDGLDKIFASLSGFEYRDEYAAGKRNPLITLVVSERKMVCDDVVQLTFKAADGEQLPTWDAGSHLDLHLPSGRRKHYSLCGDRQDRSSYQIAVRRMPAAGGSWEMHELSVGAQVTTRAPRNGFPFVADERALFIAGGIGITPIIAMVREARELGIDWFLVYSGRSRSSLPFLDEIEDWERDRVLIRTDEDHGTPDAAELLQHASAGGAVYCCGPGPMIDAVLGGFGQTPATELHFERFSAPPVVDGVEFEIELARSGRVLTVPADRSMLETVRAEVPDVAYSCRQGFCGTCRTRVLSGTPDHRDSRLSPQEQENEMLICVSRASGGRVVIDL
ncbi:PDR/VanB family oxidoreductase [Nocardia sp. 348MFTsu5.1]|uniref:PDR/VanB family oxidoreductase n=1 Tax=Nocardia sp. 348MFTsu5.1 TaxID=1172185 RepID=UPI0003728F92|nr:PDR/VanB family oxidoreductase [Nocardia sp. 348MFTsu5.1]